MAKSFLDKKEKKFKRFRSSGDILDISHPDELVISALYGV